ncbi:MAG: MutL protein [Firmicutes bacterium]|nr:MutL protein [Bacillota bacterium]
MGTALLIDFGSTYTKVVAVDMDDGTLLAGATSLTTIATDITLGMEEAVAKIEERLGGKCQFHPKLACSSAAGGLRMIAIGLVPDFTVEAARRAALGAGARVLGAYAYELTKEELSLLEKEPGDIILLAGGTDGGDKKVLLHNARFLARSRINVPIILAGNKVVAPEAARILRESGKDVRVTKNVMPELGELNIEPARDTIRQVFMEKIVEAKGLQRAEAFVDGGILMPTPAAVLAGARLLADGVPGEEGIGELMVIDVGGATTDVHSVAEGKPRRSRTIVRGLPEPRAKRTVEGDLGLRVSALSLLESAGKERVQENIGVDVNVEAMISRLSFELGWLPETPTDWALDRGMAVTAVEKAVARHVGTLREFCTPTGQYFIQEGKDLTGVGYVLATGGIFVHLENPREVLARAFAQNQNPLVLQPTTPQFLLDRHYILWAAGLLGEIAPRQALGFMKKSIDWQEPAVAKTYHGSHRRFSLIN